MNFPGRSLITLAVLVGIVFLQIFLSKQKSRWPGLILPAISFCIGLLFPLNMVMPPEGVTGSFIVEMIAAFLLANIPTIILILLYFWPRLREKKRHKKQLEKMNIQDLQ